MFHVYCPLVSSIRIPGPYRRQTAFALPQRDSQRLWQEYIAVLKDRLVLLPIDCSVAMIFAKIKSQMESSGEPRADFDLLIAGTCLKRLDSEFYSRISHVHWTMCLQFAFLFPIVISLTNLRAQSL